MSTRVLALCCPDWPVVAAGLVGVPSAVLDEGRVVACSPAAREAGLRVGQRRRQAEAACPGAVLVPADPARELRRFLPVVEVLERFAERVELTRPGVCCLAARGPARSLGGEEALAATLAAAVDEALAPLEAPACRVGIADSPFAALLAAAEGVLVPPGATASFLSDKRIEAIGDPQLAGVLRRLGIVRLGDLAALPDAAVLARFGEQGRRAQRCARGEAERPLRLARSAERVAVGRELEPPLERAEAVGFVAIALAEELLGRLRSRGLVATAVTVELVSERGEADRRCWRASLGFDARALVERVRWQLEGWTASGTPRAGVAAVRLLVEAVERLPGRQLGLWGGDERGERRLADGLARLQGLFGHEAIRRPVLRGGRGPVERVVLRAWEPGQVPRSEEPDGAPWPGRLPPPSPAVVYEPPLPAALVDVAGSDVEVGVRGELSAVPCHAGIGGAEATCEVVAWSPPWPLDEGWWSPQGRRRARLQVLLADGTAHLFVRERRRWWVEGSYD